MSDSRSLRDSSQTPRRTVQRDAVLDALRQTDAFISAQDLCDSMSSGPIPVSLATVYRHLNAFVESGQADTVWRDRHQLFRACSGIASHLHVVCTTCGEDDQLDPPPDLLSSIAKSRGFVIEHMTVEILGQCGQCLVADSDS